MLTMSCSFLPATFSPISAQQKLLNWGLLKYGLNLEKRFLSLPGTLPKILNIDLSMIHKQISFDIN